MWLHFFVIEKRSDRVARPCSNTTALQGHYSKDQIKNRLESEKRITGSSDNIAPPEFIMGDEIALREFDRIVEELKKVSLATNVDATMLGLYADSYSKYYEATLALQSEPLVVEYMNKSGNVNSVPNPYIKIQQQYAAMLMKISTMYGLDPSSRSKLASLSPSDKEEEQDKLSDLLDRLK